MAIDLKTIEQLATDQSSLKAAAGLAKPAKWSGLGMSPDGALAWGEETRGDDWDVKVAESLLIRWFAAAIERAPDAETGVLAQLGDFLHTDGLLALTPESKNVLDADTRFQKIVRIAIRLLRPVIALLLAKHKRVIVLCAEGNHDPASSIWLREWLSAIY